ncbi:MAG: acetoin utilization protein AcuC [Nitrospirota bacterium]
MKTAFIYSDDFARYSYGHSHPLKPYRLKLTYELIKAYGLLSLPDVRVIEAQPPDGRDLLMFHEKDYIAMLKTVNNGEMTPASEFFGLGPGDNPVFEGVYDWSSLVAGASLQAADLIMRGGCDITFNIAGGLHHAMPGRASGFCYINDPVLAIMSLLKNGMRVAYVDIDAHHGDGVQYAFYSTDRVLTVSLHETGTILFPGSGFENETGAGRGEGYSVNIPLPPTCDDQLFVYAFEEIVPPLVGKFSPDVVVTQLGVDSFHGDPLAHLNFTNNGFVRVVESMKEIAPKWLALGGGGYDMANVARAWTLAWAVMNDVEISDEIPEDFLRLHGKEGFGSGRLKDSEYVVQGPDKEAMRKEVERVLDSIRERVFPKLGI